MLLFDLLGSLLDEDAGQRRAVHEEPSLSEQAGDRFVQQWSARFHDLVRLIRDRREAYQTPEKLYARAAQWRTRVELRRAMVTWIERTHHRKRLVYQRTLGKGFAPER